MYPLAEDMSKHLGQNSFKYFAPRYALDEDMSEIYAHPLPRVYAIFWFAIELSAKAQPPQHTTTGVRAPSVASPPSPPRAPLLLCAEEVEPWLTIQWQTEKLHILLAEEGHIFLTCLQLGDMGLALG